MTIHPGCRPINTSIVGVLLRLVEPGQYVSLAYADTLAEHGIVPSVGSVGDSYDNALAEAVNGLYKTELIHARRSWPNATAVELATMDWVHWWNTRRLHEALGYRTPDEIEQSYTHTADKALEPA